MNPGPGAALVLPARLPGICLATGLAYVMARSDLYLQVLAKFLELRAAAGRELRAALAAGDAAGAERVAHSMISSATMIGALNLADSARLLQEALRTGPEGGCGTLLECFDRELAIVIEGLRAELPVPGLEHLK